MSAWETGPQRGHSLPSGSRRSKLSQSFPYGAGAASRFALPNQISFDAAGNLWVLDQSVTPAGVVSTVAYEPGYFTFNGYTPPPTAKSLPSALPSMLANPTGGVYVRIGCAIEKIGR